MSIWDDAPHTRDARVGFGRASLDIPPGKALAGYGPGGSGIGAWTRTAMLARAMYVEGANGERAAVVVIDLMSASRYLHERIAAGTADLGLSRDRLVVCGTHTHTGPSGFYGNSLYDTLAAHDLLRGFDRALADHLADRAVIAVREAARRAEVATVRVDVERVWGVSHNRSLAAFSRNEDHLLWNTLPGMPGAGAPAGLAVEQLRVDPRVVVLSAFDTSGRRFGVFATFACHNTAQGPRAQGTRPFYDPDWTGAAARQAESRGDGAPDVLVALSGAGDQSPMPGVCPDNGPGRQGPERAEWVGGHVAQAIARAGLRGAAGARPPTVRIAHTDWWTDRGGPDPSWATIDGARLAPWCFGASTLAGSEDGRSDFYPTLAWEGMSNNDFPAADLQHPKARALGLLQEFLRCAGDLRPAPVHSLHVLRIGDHAFATVPGEPTAWVAHEIETALRDAAPAPGRVTASVLGYAGDYAGYFTTRAEFRAQHYEGASTLFGRESAEHLTARLRHLASRPHAAAPFVAPTASLTAQESLRSPQPTAAAPEPYGYLHPAGVVGVWTYPRSSAPAQFSARVVERRDGASTEVDPARVRVEPRDLHIGADEFTAWVVTAAAADPVRSAWELVSSEGSLNLDGALATIPAASVGPESARMASIEPESAGFAAAAPKRFAAVLATWNSFGVPQIENIATPVNPGSDFPARYKADELTKAIDGPDVLCAQELIGTDARKLFHGLTSLTTRIARGGLTANDHGLGIASRLAVEATREMFFGVLPEGTDGMIAKGALYARVRLTAGPAVDVVTTHLQSGGESAKVAVRSAQLDELVAFIKAVSDPSRPLLVCGDFNVDGMDPNKAEYRALRQRMAALGLEDLDAAARRPTADPVRNDLLRQHEKGAVRERLDYLFWRGVNDAFELRVEKVSLFLDKPLTSLRTQWKYVTGYEPDAWASDHFGLQLELSYLPKRS